MYNKVFFIKSANILTVTCVVVVVVAVATAAATFPPNDDQLGNLYGMENLFL